MNSLALITEKLSSAVRPLLLITSIIGIALAVFGQSTTIVTAGHSEVSRDIGEYFDYAFAGVDPDDRAGYDVDGGDVSGDGIADLIIGAEHADPNGQDNAGTTYVVFGPVTSSISDLETQADVIVNGHDRFDCVGAGCPPVT